jgi:hypothetical protein
VSGKKAKAKVIKLADAEVPEYLRTVYDDLAFLQSMRFERPSRTEVRISSSVLRRLLHEHMLAAAWRISELPDQPRITAVDLDAVVGDVPRRYIHYAYAGGAPTKRAQHSGYALLVIPKDEVSAGDYDATARAMSQKLRAGARRDFSLPDFCGSASVISGGAAVTRVDVVRYVANKLGGVHWDNERGGWTTPQGSRHRLLDEQHIVVGGLPGALYEVISIAHALVSAPDVARLMQTIDQRAPEDESFAEVLKFREGRIGKYADMTFRPNPSRMNFWQRVARWLKSTFTA